MLTFKEAIKIAENNLPEGLAIYPLYGEIREKYVFSMQDSSGMIPPGGGRWTVHKETGECKFEYLERDGDKPWSPIKGYKKITPNKD